MSLDYVQHAASARHRGDAGRSADGERLRHRRGARREASTSRDAYVRGHGLSREARAAAEDRARSRQRHGGPLLRDGVPGGRRGGRAALLRAGPDVPQPLPEPERQCRRARRSAARSSRRARISASRSTATATDWACRITEGTDVLADRVLMLLTRPVLARHPGAPVVFDVKCSQALVDDIEAPRRHGPSCGRRATPGSSRRRRRSTRRSPASAAGTSSSATGSTATTTGSSRGCASPSTSRRSRCRWPTLLADAPQYVTSPEINAALRRRGQVRGHGARRRGLQGGVRRPRERHQRRARHLRRRVGARAALLQPARARARLRGEDPARRWTRIKETFRTRLARYPEIATAWQNE